MNESAVGQRGADFGTGRIADPAEGIRRLVGTIGAEIAALKQEREADHAREARMRLSEAYAKARLERRAAEDQAA